MAKGKQRNFVERLVDVGEDAVQRMSTAPGADRLLGTVNTLRDRVEDVQKRVRGLEGLDKRLADVERRLDELEGRAKPTPRKSTPGSTAPKRSSSSS